MKVYIFIPTLGSGGAEKIIVDYCNYLSEKNHDVCLVVNDASGHRAEDLNGSIELHELGASNIYWSIFPLLYFFLRKRPRYILSTLKEFNVYCLASNFLTLNFGRIVIREANTLSSEFDFEGSFVHGLKKRVIRKLYPKADGIIALSNSMKKDILTVIPSVIPSRVVVAPNPVDVPEKISGSESVDPSIIRLVTVARLYPTKRIDLVINAVPHIKKLGYRVELTCVGEGEEERKLIALVEALGLKKDVKLIGFSNCPGSHVRSSDVFVLASDFEGMPNSLLEAIALGVKSVCRDVPGGGPEVIETSGYGIVSKAENPEVLAADIIECFSRKFDEQKALEYLRENHDREKVFRRYTCLLSGEILQ